MDAAERLLYEKGTEDAVSMREIARGVGCTPPALYMHFQDKEELFFNICQRRFAEFDDYVEKAARGIDDPLEGLRARGQAYVRFGLEHPEHYRLLMMTPKAHSAEELGQDSPGMQAFTHLVQAVERCVASGDLSSIDPMQATFTMWAGVHGVTSLMITFTDLMPRDQEQIDLMLDVLVEGLLAS